jgi:hypothetical protein
MVDRACRSVLVAVVMACGGNGKPPAQPVTPSAGEPPAGTVAAAGGCGPAYSEYERRWKVARSEELSSIDWDAQNIEIIVGEEVATLPKRDELDKLRTMYALLDVFSVETSWTLAISAATAAIEHCGEGAARPT